MNCTYHCLLVLEAAGVHFCSFIWNWRIGRKQGVQVRLWAPREELVHKASVLLNEQYEDGQGDLSDPLLCHRLGLLARRRRPQGAL